MFAFGPGELLDGRLEMYRMHLSQQFHWFFVVVAVVGLMSMFHRDRPVFAMLGLLYAGWLLYALEYDIADIWVYFIPTYLVICILVAPGIVALIEGTRLVLSTLTLSSTLRAAPKVLVLLAIGGAPGAGDRGERHLPHRGPQRLLRGPGGHRSHRGERRDRRNRYHRR